MEKFQKDNESSTLTRGELTQLRQDFLDAGDGRATEKSLKNLYEYVNK